MSIIQKFQVFFTEIEEVGSSLNPTGIVDSGNDKFLKQGFSHRPPHRSRDLDEEKRSGQVRAPNSAMCVQAVALSFRLTQRNRGLAHTQLSNWCINDQFLKRRVALRQWCDRWWCPRRCVALLWFRGTGGPLVSLLSRLGVQRVCPAQRSGPAEPGGHRPSRGLR